MAICGHFDAENTFALPSHKIDELFRARGRACNIGERAHGIRDTGLGSTFVFEGLLNAE